MFCRNAHRHSGTESVPGRVAVISHLLNISRHELSFLGFTFEFMAVVAVIPAIAVRLFADFGEVLGAGFQRPLADLEELGASDIGCTRRSLGRLRHC